MKRNFTRIISLLLLLIALALPILTACGKKTDGTQGTEACEHVYEFVCDAVCDICGETREAEDHRYSGSCDPDCNLCGHTREAGEHSDADYDDRCDSCGTNLPAHTHVYDGTCDGNCNLCGASRKDVHSFDNACDEECNLCGHTRVVGEHEDPDEDHVCNICGARLDSGFDLPEVPAITVPSFDTSSIPTFDNSVDYIPLNNNTPYFTKNQITTEAYAFYSPLDSLGRSGMAVGCLGTELFPTANRGSLPDPSGWHSGSIYERSHLIAHSLAGCDDANNLVTGTYDLNGVMQSFEQLVKDYIVETRNHVMYRVTPVFGGNNLVASGLIMEAWSVEDSGEGICFNVYIYNEQDDEIIDHATGAVTVPVRNYTFVANANKNNSTWKIHLPTCKSVADMKDENKLFWEGTYDELVAYIKSCGKAPSNCGNCHPESHA